MARKAYLRTKFSKWKTNLVGAIWLSMALKSDRPNSKDRILTPTSTELKAELDKSVWDQLFSESDPDSRRPKGRTIQSVQQKFKSLHGTFLEGIQERVVKPLGDGWPRKDDDLAYMIALQRLWSRQSRNGGRLVESTSELWTREEIDVALELKTAFDWPNGFDESAGEGHRKQWKLQHPYSHGEIPGEIAIIKELALRRVCSEAGVESFNNKPNNDIYELLMDSPWRRTLAKSPLYGEARFTRPVWATMLWEGLEDTSVMDISGAIRAFWRDHLDMSAALTGALSDTQADLQPAKQYILGFLEHMKRAEQILDDLCPPPNSMIGSATLDSTPSWILTPFQVAINALPIKHTWDIGFQGRRMLEWGWEHIGMPVSLSSAEDFDDFEQKIQSVTTCSELKGLLPMWSPCDGTAHEGDLSSVEDYLDQALDRHQQGFGLWCEVCDSRSFPDEKFSEWRNAKPVSS